MKNISNSFSCRKAFSLAEILITIGILGVVSALTLPSLINKYQEKQLVTSYLRVYSILENADRVSAFFILKIDPLREFLALRFALVFHLAVTSPANPSALAPFSRNWNNGCHRQDFE